MTKNVVGTRLSLLREKADLTQLDLATAASVDPATISRIERGVADPSFKVLAKLARALDVELPRLLAIDSIWEFLVEDYLVTPLGKTASEELAARLRKMRAGAITRAIVHQARLKLEGESAEEDASGPRPRLAAKKPSRMPR